MAIVKAVRGARVMIEAQIEPEISQTASGIYIKKIERQRPQVGVVVQVGPGDERGPVTLDMGDNVLFRRGAGDEHIIGDKSYLIMMETDVSVVL